MPTVVATKAPTLADTAMQSAYQAAKKRYAAAGTGATILTGGQGDLSAVATARKSLLGE